MSSRTKRTYNLSPDAIAHVRELIGRVGSPTSQDGVVEYAIERLYREFRDGEESAQWAMAAEDAEFRAEMQSLADSLWRSRLVAQVIKALRWAVVLVDLDPSVGHEQAGQRRALVVSYEAFHRSGMATVCPISARPARYPGEVSISQGHAGQSKDAVILCHQVRTIDLTRVTTFEIAGRTQYVTDGELRRQVRLALSRHLGLDVPPAADGVA